MKVPQADQILGATYILLSMGLAFFCLYQSHQMGHDQQARELAGRSIRKTTTESSKRGSSWDLARKRVGEKGD